MSDTFRSSYRELTPTEKGAVSELKQKALALHDFIGTLGTSRELSLAKTKIEEAVMWATKHVTA